MLVPYIDNKEYVSDYLVKRRVPSGLEIVVKKGQKVSKDTIIAKGTLSVRKSIIDVFSFFKTTKRKKVAEVIRCIHGQRVSKGEVLAVKGSSMIASKKVLISPIQGIVDLSEISSGILNIKGYSREFELLSKVNGIVTNYLKDKYVTISSQVLKFKPFDILGKSSQGSLEFLKSNFKSNFDKNSMKGKIYVLENSIKLDELRFLEINAVRGVVIGGLDYDFYEKFRNLSQGNLNIVLTEGFGNIAMANETLELLKKLTGTFCDLNSKDNEMIFTGIEEKEEYYNKDNSLLKSLEKGDKVRMTNFVNWGEYGVVSEILERVVLIEKANGEKVKVNVLNLSLC